MSDPDMSGPGTLSWQAGYTELVAPPVAAALHPAQEVAADAAVPDRALAAHPVLLDLEEIGEVGGDEQLELHTRVLGPEVAQHEVLAHPLADVAMALDDERGLDLPVPRRGAAHEHGLERLARQHGEHLDGSAVDEQLPPGEQARVAHEEALRAVRLDVAVDVAHAERRPFDERHGLLRGRDDAG